MAMFTNRAFSLSPRLPIPSDKFAATEEADLRIWRTRSYRSFVGGPRYVGQVHLSYTPVAFPEACDVSCDVFKSAETRATSGL